MKSEIVVIGGGASGLMAAYHAARTLVEAGVAAQVTVLEKMPRPARKVMITGKGRCNFTNVKDWNAFSGHVRSKPNFVKSAFYNLPSQAVVDWFESFGMATVVERGDRAFPASYHASDVVDTLVNACHSLGVKIETDAEVGEVLCSPADECFRIRLTDGREWKCRRVIVATGGLSYPTTGSTGDGLRWAAELGHRIVPTFPSLTALVPKGYKIPEIKDLHIDRSAPLSELGRALCGVQLKNILLSLQIEGTEADSEFGDIDFTDGGLEGPVGFQLSRKAVKALVNGSRVALVLDLKPGVDLTELTVRIKSLWEEIGRDPRSRGVREKERCRILLGKLLPRELIPGFMQMHPEILTLERRGRADTKVWVNLVSIAKALKAWQFDIAGYVGYERAVVTAGGVSTDDFVAKTMESRLVPGLYLCGEVLDIDADTGGYNLQLAFATGALAGRSAAKSLPVE
ncbi:MAG: aminoacetone oxidase family FAD-binding enzyme [Bacteroidales bacterium]|jgi:predicted Rossmann fold flavoprotein|nr:aminoacetone oxidase family FAD-binding enzyme [Bacteroidales bacterium]